MRAPPIVAVMMVVVGIEGVVEDILEMVRRREGGRGMSFGVC